MSNQTYRILLDGKWSLEDLMNFSRIYFQNYSFLYCLESDAVPVANDHVENVLRQYELRHGLSYVNIYDVFRSNIAKDDFPQIKSIHYASPGWLDLALNVDVALQFAKVLGIYLGAPLAVAQTYKKLYAIFSDLAEKRKKLKLSTLKLDKAQAVEAQKLSNELAKGLGFQSIQKLDEHTKDTEESSKLLMAHYRRVKKIAKFVESGKASFPADGES
ncbi:hypothetical protein [Thalassotalea marina]|uniref:Uncharacterized protein n=1 Tax=Thalassotalea marina TaxID=1673741 RepID=A0A919EKD4_9GAMM|nr:hypothetical protein [Thalassotalea marina]GHF91574.1 hypothetical protein GCM10017161_19300 [Thalassotalea marina]